MFKDFVMGIYLMRLICIPANEIKYVNALYSYIVHSEVQSTLGNGRVGTNIGLGCFVLYTFRANRIAGLRGTSL